MNNVLKLADELWQYMLLTQPYYAVRTGVPVQRLRPGSLADAEADAAFGTSLRLRLRSALPASLTDADRVTAEFLDDACQRLEEAPQCWWTSFPFTPYMAFNIAFIAQIVFPAQVFLTAAGVDQYLRIAEDYVLLLRTQTARIRAQAKRAWCIPRPALEGVRTTLLGMRAGTPRYLTVKPSRLAATDRAGRQHLIDSLDSLIAGRLLPAFDEAIGLFDAEYGRAAPGRVGLSQYPGGDAAYALWIRRHMSFDLSADEVHARGHSEVERLTDAMAEIRAREGFKGDEAAFAAHLEASGRLHAKSAEQVAARYRHCIERIRPLVGRYFHRLPGAPYDVKRLDPSAEPGISYGYYEPPTAAQPIGLYRYNGSGLDTRIQLTAPALIYHELVPGHHFHLARQAENDQLPAVRRQSADLSVFNEGWAEYASGLAGEIGLYDDPYDAYGRLLHERFTAQRLVTDTGLNALGWTLERAREYMARTTLESATQIATETLRYSTDLPGQALAYRIGYLKFMELREATRHSLGKRFDIRDFHEAVLGEGALPFPILARHLERIVKRVKRI